ncbi:MAG: c-type cytochrome [Bryobacterales bacterium]|nr:c-type cytochrome [Bryobacterales bacterium]
MRWLLAWMLAAGPPIPLGLDRYLPVPEGNALEPAKVALGRALFRDKLLSRDESIACATCHDAAHGFADGRSLAQGVRGQVGDRRSPTIVNRAFGKMFFWDGRVKTLEEQVLQPVANPKEMDLPVSEAVGRVKASAYAAEFYKVFGREVCQEDVSRALASYVRTILAGDSPYDRYMAGDSEAMSAKALEGLRLFRGKAACVSCHVGVNFTDERLHNTGFGMFKTPTLRQVAERAPYLHDGSMATLADVVEFYDQGGKEHPQRDRDIRKLGLTAGEKEALVAFLEALSGRIVEGPW